MIKNIAFLFSLAVACVALPNSAHAQTNFVFSSFQCDPLSCTATTPVPEFQAQVSVDFIGTCTGGAVGTIESVAVAVVGATAPCLAPYTPVATNTVTTEEFLDDFGCNPFFVDTVTASADILDFFGNPVFHKSTGFSCEGGTSGPFVVGTIPC
jgi:hypothetical protein